MSNRCLNLRGRFQCYRNVREIDALSSVNIYIEREKMQKHSSRIFTTLYQRFNTPFIDLSRTKAIVICCGWYHNSCVENNIFIFLPNYFFPFTRFSLSFSKRVKFQFQHWPGFLYLGQYLEIFLIYCYFCINIYKYFYLEY